MNYTLKIIPGTQDYVLAEIAEKLPEVKVVEVKRNIINVDAPFTDIDGFRELKSVLHVKNDEGIERNLFRREWRKETLPASINPALAYILCAAAEVDENDVVLDPFCGAGTIAITASLYFKAKKSLASDLSGTAVDATIHNFKSAGVKQNKYAVFRSNVSGLKLQKDSVTKLISNLPFGIRTGDHEKNIQSYKALAAKAKIFLKPGGTMVLYTQEKKLIEEIFKGFKLVKSLDVEQGGLTPKVFILKA